MYFIYFIQVLWFALIFNFITNVFGINDEDRNYHAGNYFDKQASENNEQQYTGFVRPFDLNSFVRELSGVNSVNNFPVTLTDISKSESQNDFGFAKSNFQFPNSGNNFSPFDFALDTNKNNLYTHPKFNKNKLESKSKYNSKEENDNYDTNKSEDLKLVKPGPNYISHKVYPKAYQNQDELDILNEYNVPQNQHFEGNFKNPKKLKTLSAQTQYYPSKTDKAQAKTSLPYLQYGFQPSEKFPNNLYSKSAASTIPEYYEGISIPDYKSDLGVVSEFKNLDKTSEFSSPNREDTETVTRKVCKKIEKDFPFDSQLDDSTEKKPMTCFICKDANSDSVYEKCSYKVSPKSKKFNYNLENYDSQESRPHFTYRYKRYTETVNEKNEDEGESEGDEDSHKSYEETPEDHTFVDDYKFEPYNITYSFEPSIEDDFNSFSETQSEELRKHPENCKIVKRGNMECNVCKDPKTNGNFEQCSYDSKPDDKKYGYYTESSYNSKDDPASGSSNKSLKKRKNKNKDKDIEQGEETNDDIICKEVYKKSLICTVCENPKNNYKTENCVKNRKRTKSSQLAPEETKINEEKNYDHLNNFKDISETALSKKKKSNDRTYGGSKRNYKVSNREENNEEDKKDDEQDEESNEQYRDDPVHSYTPPNDFGAYFSKLFPEYLEVKKETPEVKEESPHNFANFDEKFQGSDSNLDTVEKVIDEFEKKDRSNCKKIIKGHLSCFICKDKNGIKNEECVYISEPQPKKIHNTYHKKGEYNSNPKNEEEETENKNEELDEDEENVEESKNKPKIETVETKNLDPIRK